MLGKKIKQQIKDLNLQWNNLEWEITDVDNNTTDPDIRSYYISELLCVQDSIELEIANLEHKLAMIPLKFMLGGFVIFVIGMTIYMMS
jgi:hypothetical protein